MIHPYGRRISVQDAPANTDSGIILPEGVRPRRAIVTEVGYDVPYLQPGFVVYFPAGYGVDVGDLTFLEAGYVFAWESN